MVGAVRLPGIAFIQLVEIDNFCAAVRKEYITQGGDAVPFPVLDVYKRQRYTLLNQAVGYVFA